MQRQIHENNYFRERQSQGHPLSHQGWPAFFLSPEKGSIGLPQNISIISPPQIVQSRSLRHYPQRQQSYLYTKKHLSTHTCDFFDCVLYI